MSGAQNPKYSGVFVFDNDHPCVASDAPAALSTAPGINRNRPATGVARVVCYSAHHALTLGELGIDHTVTLLETWQAQYLELGSRAEVQSVFIFENKGEVVGVSNPHPHCQIYATNFVFKTIEVELEAARDHFQQTGRVLFQDVVAAEVEDGRRLVAGNEHAIAFVPYFARYAYETYVAPRRTTRSVADLTPAELRDFAAVLRQTLIRFDNLWQMPFPYVMVLHQAPTDGQDHPGFHFHVQFHPPMRRPDLLKYLAGPEVGGGGFLSDTWPEDKAAELRAAAPVHYRSHREPS